MIKQTSRILQKRTQTSGQTPTLPPSSDHTDDTWINSDIYPGEIFFNMYDKKGYIGLTGGSGSFIFLDATGSTANINTERFWNYQPIIITQVNSNTIDVSYDDNFRYKTQPEVYFYTIEKDYPAGSSGETLDISYMFQHPNASDYNYIFEAMMLLYDDTAGDVFCGQWSGTDVGGPNYPHNIGQMVWRDNSSNYDTVPTGFRWNIDPTNYPSGTFPLDNNFSVISTINSGNGIGLNVEFDSPYLTNDTKMKAHFRIYSKEMI